MFVGKKLILGCPTRWSSIIYRLKAFNDHYIKINDLILNSKIEVNLSVFERRIGENIIKILSPLKESILRLSNNTKLMERVLIVQFIAEYF